ncbi:MAG TPA: hypothetical protein HPP81_01335 [Deltaproteobacteria bacterium]|nr:hypothetical protein [Deltaproteobacteria bacterium]
MEKTTTSTKKSILEHILEEINGATRGLPDDNGGSSSETICEERINELLGWAANTPSINEEQIE